MSLPHEYKVVKRVSLPQTGTGAKELAAAKAGYAFRVLSYIISPETASEIVFKSASTVISVNHAFVGAVLAPFDAAYNPHGHFQTAVGEALNAVSDDAGTYSVTVVYAEIKIGP